MLYLFLLRQRGNPTVIQMKNILDTYHRSRGSEVKMLGGQRVDVLPKDPDTYVIATCLTVCKKNQISFDSNRDQIVYNVGYDNIENESIGGCEITVRTPVATSNPTKEEIKNVQMQEKVKWKFWKK
jgi:hypothetical protein